MTIIINKPHLCTKLDIWHPKYGDVEEWEAWLAVSKVTYASPVILIEFTRAKHLQGQRFAVRRDVVERCPRGTNGRIAVFRVPFSKLESWQTSSEVAELANLAYPE